MAEIKSIVDVFHSSLFNSDTSFRKRRSATGEVASKGSL